MRKSDPFTTDKARVIAETTAARERQLEIDAQAALPKVKEIFGHLGEIRFKQYFGEEGGWRVGFKSAYGFHTRGSGATAAEAAARMQRQPDDPFPHWDSWVPGSTSRPFERFDGRICPQCHPERSSACSAA